MTRRYKDFENPTYISWSIDELMDYFKSRGLKYGS